MEAAGAWKMLAQPDDVGDQERPFFILRNCAVAARGNQAEGGPIGTSILKCWPRSSPVVSIKDMRDP